MKISRSNFVFLGLCTLVFGMIALDRAAPVSEGQTLLSAAAATGASTTAEPFVDRNEVGYAQVSITGTATVNMDVRIHSSAPWTTAYTFTSSGMAQIPRCSQMRFNVTSYTSGTVSAWISR